MFVVFLGVEQKTATDSSFIYIEEEKKKSQGREKSRRKLHQCQRERKSLPFAAALHCIFQSHKPDCKMLKYPQSETETSSLHSSSAGKHSNMRGPSLCLCKSLSRIHVPRFCVCFFLLLLLFSTKRAFDSLDLVRCANMKKKKKKKLGGTAISIATSMSNEEFSALFTG